MAKPPEADHHPLDFPPAEAAEIMESDPANAERFFGNRVVAGSASWLPRGMWERAWRGAVAA